MIKGGKEEQEKRREGVKEKRMQDNRIDWIVMAVKRPGEVRL